MNYIPAHSVFLCVVLLIIVIATFVIFHSTPETVVLSFQNKDWLRYGEKVLFCAPIFITSPWTSSIHTFDKGRGASQRLAMNNSTRRHNAIYMTFYSNGTTLKVCLITSPWGRRGRIRPQHPLACRKRRLNGAACLPWAATRVA